MPKKIDTVESILNIPTKEQMRRMYHTMIMSEELDRIQKVMHNYPGSVKVFFQIYGSGHEGIQVALACHLEAGKDAIFPYYRDLALNLMLTTDAKEILLGAVGSSEDPASGGRQFAMHYGSKEKSVFHSGSPIAMQMIPSVGYALGGKIADKVKGLSEMVHNHTRDGIVVCCAGDGAMSEGESPEAFNFAGVNQLPVLFLVEDDNFAISVPIHQQTAGGSISKFLAGLHQSGVMKIWEVDGCNVFESFRICGEVVKYIRENRKPAMIHAKVVRQMGHSGSDDRRRYMTQKAQEAEEKRIPQKLFKKALLERGYFTAAELEKIEKEVKEELNEAKEYAMAAARPQKEDIGKFLFEPGEPACSPKLAVKKSPTTPETYKVFQALNRTLHEEMARDPRVICFGEDVGDGTPDDLVAWDPQQPPWLDTVLQMKEKIQRALDQGKVHGKGGVFQITVDLQKRFGIERCFNSPLAEATIIGVAIGLAMRGFRPIPEIQFIDYIYPAFEQIRNNLSNYRWRSYNNWNLPVVIRTTSGGYLQGSGALCHSQSAEATFAHVPGLYLLMPSTVSDAVGLLKTALRHNNDPVLFMEEKILYRVPDLEEPFPGENYTVPFGKARMDIAADHNRRGPKVTLVTYGATRYVANKVVKEHFQGKVDLIDLRTIMPWDKEMVFDSVRKTGRVLTLHGAGRTAGFGAEIAAEIVEKCFDYLDIPVRRLAAADLPVPYGIDNESWVLPQPEDIARTIEEMLAQ